MRAADRPPCPPSPRPTRPTAALLAAALLGAGALAACGAQAAEQRGAGAAAASAPAGPGADSAALRAAADSGRMQGAAGARVWLLMASDFQCPYCKQWHDETYAPLARDYVATGRVRAAFLNFPLDQHPQAMPSAEAAMCASAQKKFWPYHTALFETQARWSAAGAGDASPVYDSLATAVGADLPRFRACTRSHVMRALVEADRDRMQRAGVQSTPSFFVGDRAISGAQPTATFRAALDAALAR
jgi:protein-disulfide isomerase